MCSVCLRHALNQTTQAKSRWYIHRSPDCSLPARTCLFFTPSSNSYPTRPFPTLSPIPTRSHSPRWSFPSWSLPARCTICSAGSSHSDNVQVERCLQFGVRYVRFLESKSSGTHEALVLWRLPREALSHERHLRDHSLPLLLLPFSCQ